MTRSKIRDGDRVPAGGGGARRGDTAGRGVGPRIRERASPRARRGTSEPSPPIRPGEEELEAAKTENVQHDAPSRVSQLALPRWSRPRDGRTGVAADGRPVYTRDSEIFLRARGRDRGNGRATGRRCAVQQVQLITSQRFPRSARTVGVSRRRPRARVGDG
jgi:hypothetical protein